MIYGADLEAMYWSHQLSGALATLAVSDRDSNRVLRFDADGLQARVDRQDGGEEPARPVQGEGREWAFAGIHVVEAEISDLMEEEGAFSVNGPYLRLVGEGHRIMPWDVSGALWLEIGDPDRLELARRVLRETPMEGESR